MEEKSIIEEILTINLAYVYSQSSITARQFRQLLESIYNTPVNNEKGINPDYSFVHELSDHELPVHRSRGTGLYMTYYWRVDINNRAVEHELPGLKLLRHRPCGKELSNMFYRTVNRFCVDHNLPDLGPYSTGPNVLELGDVGDD